jgi:dihydroflavonol-4-reductase
MRILVTGGAGFIGSHICRALVQANHDVRVLCRPTSDLRLIDALPVERVYGDILDRPSLAEAVQTMQAVIHCAGAVGRGITPKEISTSHVQGTLNVLAASRQAGVQRFVYTSSVAALGAPPLATDAHQATVPLMDETHEWNLPPGQWPYGHAKHLAEKAVRQAADDGLAAVVVNPSLVFGAGDLHMISGRYLVLIARGLRPPVIPGGLNAVHILDVVEGHLAALQHGRPGERYLLTGENVTIHRLLSMICQVTGRPGPSWPVPLWTLRLIAWISSSARSWLGLRLPVNGEMLRFAGRHFYYDNRKARRHLGLDSPRPLQAAIDDAYQWYRSAGMI